MGPCTVGATFHKVEQRAPNLQGGRNLKHKETITRAYEPLKTVFCTTAQAATSKKCQLRSHTKSQLVLQNTPNKQTKVKRSSKAGRENDRR